MSYPEHEKLSLIMDKSQAIHDFLEWAAEKGWFLSERSADWHPSTGCLLPIRQGHREILSEFYGIDQDKLEEEKLVMLEGIREAL